ncbi:hypothetical protein AAG906_022287 [Vitis piasezkii]
MATWSESEESSEEENEKEVANMCFMAIDDLDEGSKKDKWFLDSGCLRHMTGMNPSLLSLQRERKDTLPLETIQKEGSLVMTHPLLLKVTPSLGGKSYAFVIVDDFSRYTWVLFLKRESFDDDLGSETSMGKLQIEDRRQHEEVVEDLKKEESPLTLPPPQQVQGESSQNLLKIGSLSSTTHKIKL